MINFVAEFFGITPGASVVETFDISHVGIKVAGGIECLGKSHFLFCEVDVGKDYGNVGTLGDVKEAASPLAVETACTFGRNGKVHALGLIEFLNDELSEVGTPSSRHGNAANSPEEAA